MAYLGRVPTTGDRFEWDGGSFEVVDMDGHRADKVLVTRSSAAIPDDAAQERHRVSTSRAGHPTEANLSSLSSSGRKTVARGEISLCP